MPATLSMRIVTALNKFRAVFYILDILGIYEETTSQCPGNSKETEMVPKIWAYMKKLPASVQEIQKKQK